MWHKVSAVAKTFRIEPKDLEDFAKANENKYKIIFEVGGPMVCTWFTDGLVKDFKELQDTQKD